MSAWDYNDNRYRTDTELAISSPKSVFPLVKTLAFDRQTPAG